jgi:multidrug resistance efflux pump
MAKPSRIRTPLYQHWNNFRMGLLPFLCFFLFVTITMWLWQRQAMRGSFMGEVFAVRVDVLAEGEGLLQTPGYTTGEHQFVGDSYVQLFQPVAEGQIIARIDDSILQGELKTIQAEIQELTADLAERSSTLQVRLFQLGQDFDQDRVQRIVERERYELEKSQTEAEIVFHETERKRLQEVVSILEEAERTMKGAIIRRELVDLRGQLDSHRRQVERKMKVWEQTKANLAGAIKRIEELPPSPAIPEIDQMLAAISEARRVQEGKLDLVRTQIEHQVVRAPMDGVIAAIYQYPGMAVRPGTPIVAIAQHDADFIVSYVREKHRIRPHEGQPVTIRFGNTDYQSKVLSVGAQVELVPLHHLRDPTFPEWAIPVKIEKPKDLMARPGELVPVIFHSNRS